MSTRNRCRFLRQSDGAALVEFAILCSVFLLIVLGILEFGLLWYTKQVITNATREGARYGIAWDTKADGTRKAPKDFSPSIESVVNNYITGRIPSVNCTVTVENNTAYQTGTKGSDLIVRVACTNAYDLLGGFIPALRNITFNAQTVMKCE